MSTRTTTFGSLILLSLVAAVAHGNDLSAEYAELDALLRNQSLKYRAMADVVRDRHSYRIVSSRDFPLGNVRDDDGRLVIELNPEIPQARRATVLIWEMANAYQRETFSEVTRRAITGEITSPREYGLRMELVEHGSHQLHRDVMEELALAGVHISQDFLFFLNPNLESLDEYRIPSVHDYIEAQTKSGHTKHYELWYYRVTGKTPPLAE